MWLETKISEWHRLGVAKSSRMAMQSKAKPGASSKNLLELGIFQVEDHCSRAMRCSTSCCDGSQPEILHSRI